MPRHQIDIEKFYQNEYWTNRYIVEIANVAAGHAIAQAIVDAEQAVTNSLITFTKYRISDMVPDTDNFSTVALAVAGAHADAAQLLPLFNVVRVDFSPAIGRPSRKYLRVGLSEGIVDGATLTAAWKTSMMLNYADALLAIPEFVGPQGEPFISAAVFSAVGMRQLRRGTKRKLEPVL